MTSMMDEGRTVDGVYRDFSKAFGSVNHRFLLLKLRSYDVGDAVVLWIEA